MLSVSQNHIYWRIGWLRTTNANDFLIKMFVFHDVSVATFQDVLGNTCGIVSQNFVHDKLL